MTSGPVQIAPDCDAERPFLPDPGDPHGLLAAGRSRLPQRAVLRSGPGRRRGLHRAPLAQLRPVGARGLGGWWPPTPRVDARDACRGSSPSTPDTSWTSTSSLRAGPALVGFRVVVVPGRDRAMTRLCTNLPRTPFSAALVARLYRFRWQIELLLQGVEVVREPAQVRHRESAHCRRPDLGEPLCGDPQAVSRARRAARRAGAAISTRRVAMCAHHILEALVAALLVGVGLRAPSVGGLPTCSRTHDAPTRIAIVATGRLRAGLGLAEAA